MTRLYTLKEASAQLRKSPEWLWNWLQSHPDCYILAGRDVLFSEDDLLRIVAYWAQGRSRGRPALATDPLAPAKRAEALYALIRKKKPRRSGRYMRPEAAEALAEKKKAAARRKRIPKISVSTPKGDRRVPDPRRGPNAPRIRIHPRG